MRVTKQKRHRKVVRFYSACFGFREPFKVLCDGTFIHNLILHRLTPADDTLSRILGGRVLLFTTRCIIAELKTLGSSHTEAFNAANQLVIARCDHERRVSAPLCIQAVVGEGNSEHFFLATQDGELRKKYREVPGVPVIYGLKNSLFMEQPSTHHREYVKSIEEKHLHMSESEYQKLHNMEPEDGSKNHKTDLQIGQDGFENETINAKARRNIATPRQKFDVPDRSKLKRKKAKGPNPLSCKKKKEKSSASQNQGDEKGSASKRKRSRKRKRSQNDSKLGDPAS